MIKYQITEQEYNETLQLAKTNKLKRVDKRLQVVILRYEGKTDEQIAEKTGYHVKSVSRLLTCFKRVGLHEYARHKYGGNHQAVDTAKEMEILEAFREGLRAWGAWLYRRAHQSKVATA